MYSSEEKMSHKIKLIAVHPRRFKLSTMMKLLLISSVVRLRWCRGSLLWGWGALIGWVVGGDRAGWWRSSIWGGGSLCRVSTIARVCSRGRSLTTVARIWTSLWSTLRGGTCRRWATLRSLTLAPLSRWWGLTLWSLGWILTRSWVGRGMLSRARSWGSGIRSSWSRGHRRRWRQTSRGSSVRGCRYRRSSSWSWGRVTDRGLHVRHRLIFWFVFLVFVVIILLVILLCRGGAWAIRAIVHLLHWLKDLAGVNGVGGPCGRRRSGGSSSGSLSPLGPQFLHLLFHHLLILFLINWVYAMLLDFHLELI